MPGHLTVEQDLLIFAGALVGLALLVVAAGALLLRRAPRQPFFLIRQQTAAAGWRLLIVAVAILALAGAVRLFGAQVVFQLITPTPSVTLTPSITLTPTITLTPSQTPPPTITLTATKTFTPSPSPTPFVPFNIQQQFTSHVIPDPRLVIHPLTFAESFTPDFQPVNPGDVFFNPIQKIVGIFSFEYVNLGVEWTVVWYRDGSPVYWESYPWGGGVAGNAAVIWNTTPNFFVPGTYEVQIFAGGVWKQSGTFNIVGAPPKPSATVSPTITRLPPPTETPFVLKTPTLTLTPTK